MVSRGARFDGIDGFNGFRDTEASLNGNNLNSSGDLDGSGEYGISRKVPRKLLSRPF